MSCNRLTYGIFYILLTLSVLLTFLGCDDDSPLSAQEYGTWNFSGYVVDGNSGKPLTNVTITYRDNEGNTQIYPISSDGSFFISSLPYGERSFEFVHGLSSEYTKKVTVIGAWSEATQVEGAVGDLSRIIQLFPLSATISGEVKLEVDKSNTFMPAAGVSVSVMFNDTGLNNATPSLYSTLTDSIGKFEIEKVATGQIGTLYIGNLKYDDITYSANSVDLPSLQDSSSITIGKVFMIPIDSVDSDINLVQSNTFSVDGKGISNFGVALVPYYVLPVAPAKGTITAKIEGTSFIENTVSVSGDTVFIHPVNHFDHDAMITISLSGLDIYGESISFLFDGDKQFRTEKGMYATESNFWDKSGSSYKKFKLYDTIWIRFSDTLDSDLSKIEWLDSVAENTIYGSGSKMNSNIFVNVDTLFVIPDQRLSIDYGETVGFSISLISKNGLRSTETTFLANVIDDDFYLLWTNTKDHLGNYRRDMGIMDSIVVVSNRPISEVIGLGSMSGKTTPPDLTLDNVTIRGGDTIVYKPSIFMEPDSLYGLTFDLKLADNTYRYNTLGVEWEVRNSIRILKTNNRENGRFRPFTVIGDSLVVTFSEAIDTSATAPVPFAVHLVDVNDQVVETQAKWDISLTTVTLHNLDPLPSADFSEDVDYGTESKYSRAVEKVEFDLVSLTGTVARKLAPTNQQIEIHTESGICAVDANILIEHSETEEIYTGASTVQDFEIDSPISITFNRPVDTTMILSDPNKYLGIDEKGSSSDTISFTVSFERDGLVVNLIPDTLLTVDTEYYVWVERIPASNLGAAAAIHYHSSKFSGAAVSDRIVTSAFKTEL